MHAPQGWLKGKRLSLDVSEDAPVFLAELPRRRGERPYTNPVLPHKQLTDVSPPAVAEILRKDFAKRLGDNVRVGPSHISLVDTEALHLVEPARCRRSMIELEFAHIHGQDGGLGSTHMLLSPTDAKHAVAQEWAELHLLAGETRLIGGKVRQLPSSLVMVYAPRDEEEISVVLSVLDASFKYATGADL